jgi:hypothetical protein
MNRKFRPTGSHKGTSDDQWAPYRQLTPRLSKMGRFLLLKDASLLLGWRLDAASTGNDGPQDLFRLCDVVSPLSLLSLFFFVPALIPFDGLSVAGHFYVHRGACTHGRRFRDAAAVH